MFGAASKEVEVSRSRRWVAGALLVAVCALVALSGAGQTKVHRGDGKQELIALDM